MTMARVLRGMRRGVEVASMPAMVGATQIMMLNSGREMDDAVNQEAIQQSIYNYASSVFILAVVLEATKWLLADLEAIVEGRMDLGRTLATYSTAAVAGYFLGIPLANLGEGETAVAFAATWGVAGIAVLGLSNQIVQGGTMVATDQPEEPQRQQRDIEEAYQTPRVW